MIPQPLDTFLQLLEELKILSPAQRQSVREELLDRCADARSLARELIDRDWLTPFQANRLLQGQPQELNLGPFLILDRIGEGGMGQVFKARHRKLDRVVAVKVIRQDRLAGDSHRRFFREMRAVAQLDHPNIVRAYDADEVAGTLYYSMELVPGTDLRRLVKKRGPLPVLQACDFIRQTALGLQHAWERGLVHRDLKPANLLVTGVGEFGVSDSQETVLNPEVKPVVKILDLGLARIDSGLVDEESGTITREGVVMGTAEFMSPEQSLNSHLVDIRSDLYSLGCTFFFLLTGRVPFRGTSFAEKLLKHQMEPAPPVETIRPEVPPEVSAVILCLMAKRPEDRYQSPAELAEVLADLMAWLEAQPSAHTVLESRVNSAPPEAETPAPSRTVTMSWTRYLLSKLPPIIIVTRKGEKPNWRLLALAGAITLTFVACMALLAGLLTNTGTAPARKPDEPPRAYTPPPKPKPGVVPVEVPETNPFLPGPVTDEWIRYVQTLPPEEQADAVFAKLKELNPEFLAKDRNNSRDIRDGEVVALKFRQPITDISPVRALPKLETLVARGSNAIYADAPVIALADVSPLRELKCLKHLDLQSQRVADLNPLRDLPLETLSLAGTRVSDLSPLQGMGTLRGVNLDHTPVADLGPLARHELVNLSLWNTPVADIKPLSGIHLDALNLSGTGVRDLTPLTVTALTSLDLSLCPVADLTPLAKAGRLKSLRLDGTLIRSLEPVKELSLQSLILNYDPHFADTLRALPPGMTINLQPAAEFWKIVSPGADHGAFVKGLGALAPAEQVKAVAERLKILNPGFVSPLTHEETGGAVSTLKIDGKNLTDLTPLASLTGLKSLAITSTGIGGLKNLDPLRGLPLESLELPAHHQVLDLSPLRGMPLKRLNLYLAYAPLRDLSPLRDMKQLDTLYVIDTEIADFRPLQQAPLTSLYCGVPMPIGLETLQAGTLKHISLRFDFDRHGDALSALKLETINNKPAAEFWQEQAELRVELVRRELNRLNPGLEAMVEFKSEPGGVSELTIIADADFNIAPVRHLPELQGLKIKGLGTTTGQFSNLEPLRGMKLTGLNIGYLSRLKDLSAVRDMPLQYLSMAGTGVSDLEPLRGMKTLSQLHIHNAPVTDLSPLQGLPLKVLYSGSNFPLDLTPLHGMPLHTLILGRFHGDLAFLKKTEIAWIQLPFQFYRDADILRSVKLTAINSKPAAEFWQEVDAQQKEFDAWCAEVRRQKDPEKQLTLVMDRLNRLNKTQLTADIFQIVVKDNVIEELTLANTTLEDLTPVRALAGLKVLRCSFTAGGGKLSDLWPLHGLKLTGLSVNGQSISDLTPLHGLPLTQLAIESNPVKDLTPLAEMKLTSLNLMGTQVTDLVPLAGMKLLKLNITNIQAKDLSFLRDMPLESLYAAGSNLPDLKLLADAKDLRELVINRTTITDFSELHNFPKLSKLNCNFVPWRDSALLRSLPGLKKVNEKPAQEFYAWADWEDAVRKMEPKEQVAAVAAKLTELNPKFDGTLDAPIMNNRISKLALSTDTVTDISPVRALPYLTELHCVGSERTGEGKGKLEDLGPLRGLELGNLRCGKNRVRDLSPLRGMPLKFLDCPYNPLSDFSPLKEMPLTYLNCGGTSITHLNDLQDLPLTYLQLYGTRIKDLSLLAKIKTLRKLSCANMPVTDLNPIRALPLDLIHLTDSPVTDLRPLLKCPLKAIKLSFHPWRDADTLREMKPQRINDKPAAEFWQEVDAERAKFDQRVAAIRKEPAEKQVELVLAWLAEINTDFDGQLAHPPDIKAGTVVGLNLQAVNLTDGSPLRAFEHLERLSCSGGEKIANLTDLWPLRGLRLKFLSIYSRDLEDLRPLAGMPVEGLGVYGSRVSDLAPLRDCKSLTDLNCRKTRVTDLSPLVGTNIRTLECDYVPERDAAVLRQIPTLQTINGKNKDELLK